MLPRKETVVDRHLFIETVSECQGVFNPSPGVGGVTDFGQSQRRTSRKKSNMLLDFGYAVVAVGRDGEGVFRRAVLAERLERHAVQTLPRAEEFRHARQAAFG